MITFITVLGEHPHNLSTISWDGEVTQELEKQLKITNMMRRTIEGRNQISIKNTESNNTESNIPKALFQG